MAAPDLTATQSLTRLTQGDASAADALTPLVYDQLRGLAAGLLHGERIDHTLQPTALVHEAYVRLIDQRAVSEDDRRAFLGLAATVMRRVLVDHARAKNRLKRGGDRRRVVFDDPADRDGPGRDGIDVEALDDALRRLEGMDERKARLVELRFFCGMDEPTAAEVLGVSRATASREWRTARSWLLKELKGDLA